MVHARRRVRRRTIPTVLGVLMLIGIPMSAEAADIWINDHGGIGATYSTAYGARTGAYAEDVAADSHSVRVEYYRVSTATTMYVLKDLDGSAAGTYKFAERSGKIVTMRMCVVNNNPLDWDFCSAWMS